MAKRRYTRAELTISADGDEGICVLCHRYDQDGTGRVEHAKDCPLADASVASVVLIASRPAIVFRFHDNRWWWRAASGSEYRIEKLPRRYAMFDAAGHELFRAPGLIGIRLHLKLNQGVY